MSIDAKVESNLRDEPIYEYSIEQGNLYYYHDQILGRLILARSLGDNQGAQVHLVEDFPDSPLNLTAKDIAAQANPENLYKELLPWFSTKIPTHLDSGEPAELTLQHRPDCIVIFSVRGHASLD